MYQARHTFATLMLSAGENPNWIARMMGHTSVEMLFKKYNGYIPNITHQMVQSLCRNFVKMDTFWTPAIKKGLEQSPKPFHDMVAGTGFEPATSGL